MHLRSHTRRQSEIYIQSSYSIIGATGSTGGAILHLLLQNPDNKVKVYVRSGNKLLTQKPDVAGNPNVLIYEAPLSDIKVLKDCMASTKATFLCVGTNENIPRCEISQQAAHSVVDALRLLQRQRPSLSLPKLVVLSSASLEKHLVRDIPLFGQKVLNTMQSWAYADLRQAETILRSHQSWIRQVYIKPGGLVHDTPKGYELSLERQETFTSYLDLAAGMIAIADMDAYDLQNISVIPAKKGTRIPWDIGYTLFKGLLWHCLPGLYPYLSRWMP